MKEHGELSEEEMEGVAGGTYNYYEITVILQDS